VNDRNLKLDFIYFEKSYFSSDLLENNFYALLDDPEISSFLIDSIDKNYLKDATLDKIFIKNIHDLSQLFLMEHLNFIEFKYFKTEVDILLAYMLLFLLKALSSKTKHSKVQREEIEIFSLKNFFLDRNDVANLFIDYLFKFFIFNEIIYKKIFNFNRKFLRIFSFRFIELCAKNNLITLQSLQTSKRHYKLLTFNLFKIPFVPEIILYVKKFEVYSRFDTEPYIYSAHFSSIVSITKQATYSDATFKIQRDQVDSLTQRSFFVDRSLLLNSYNSLIRSLCLNQ
jgi:hypothetical protein